MKLSYPVGTKYVYSDISMVFMQLVIEKVAGMGLDQFTQKNVFAPMNMSLTLYNPGAPYRQRNQCAPTEIYNNTWRNETCTCDVHDPTAYDLGGVSGNAGLFSNIFDLRVFMKMMLNQGTHITDQGRKIKIFEPSTVALFTKKVTGLPYVNSRALGWDTIPNQQHKPCGDCFSDDSFGHTGFTGTSVWADK